MSLTSYRAAPPRVMRSSKGGSVVASFADLAATYSPAAWAAVPWALGALTAEFGMGSGGIPPLGPPGRQRTETKTLNLIVGKTCMSHVMPGLFSRHGTVLRNQAPIERLG